MNKRFIVLYLVTFLSLFTISAENEVTFKTDGKNLTSTIKLNPGERIYLDSSTLYLIVESQNFSFIFSGYPDGEVDSNGNIFYSDNLTLSGDLIKNEDTEISGVTVNAIVGFQVVNSEGEEGIPIEVAQDLNIKSGGSSNFLSSLLLILTIFLVILFIVLLTIFLKRRRSE